MAQSLWPISFLHNESFLNDGLCDGGPPAPHTLALTRGFRAYYLQLTPHCNNRCSGCSNVFIDDYGTRRMSAVSHSKPLALAGWRNVLDKIAHHTRFVNLTGGEATLHPNFLEIVAHLKTLNLPFALLTNGRWLNPEQLIATLASVSQCYAILVSLHGVNAKTHEAFSSVTGSFAETIANIKGAVAAGLPVETSTVITHQNFHQLEQIAQLARQLGAKRAKFNRYLAWEAQHGTLDARLPSDSELKEAINAIEQMRQCSSPNFDTYYGPCIPQCFIGSASRGCSAGETFCVIDPWGNVTPCTHTHLTCGNIFEMDIEAIWEGEVMYYWRNLMPEGCLSCSALATCGTGCRAMAVETGLGHDPLMQQPILLQPT